MITLWFKEIKKYTRALCSQMPDTTQMMTENKDQV